MSEPRLTIELVPSTSWFSNVRSVVKRSEWDKIRKEVYAKAFGKCEVCELVPPKGKLHAHEVWNYDLGSKIQKLEKMVALCADCHEVKHFGFAATQNRGELALGHLGKINNWSRDYCQQYVEQAFKQWEERSLFLWKLDLRHLEQYGINWQNLGKEQRQL
jgi:hypothetical protein